MSATDINARSGSWIAFDFDGTLTRRDTLLPFLRQVLGTSRLAATLALESPWLAAYATRLVSNEAAKVHLLRRTLGGRRRDQLEAQGRAFAADGIAPLLRHEMMERLRHHQAAGHRCVLVTASLTVYTRPWALAQGFDAVIGSELAFDDSDIASGDLVGANCYGPEKARRLQELLGDHALSEAYGDSRGDREMLAMAGAGHWSKKRPPLVEHRQDQ
jgi:phosphatidylglycerophosphatase C